MNPGYPAAMVTALCWSFAALLFSRAGRRVGSLTVNFLRLLMGATLTPLCHLFLYGSLFPLQVTAPKLLLFILSGFFTFAVGDALVFEAFVLVGARLTQLIMTLVPVFVSILGWILLGEFLRPLQIGVIGITLAGIALGVWDLTEGRREVAPRKKFVGILYASAGSLSISFGTLFSKIGLSGGFSPLSANLISLAAGFIGILLFSLISGKITGFLGSLKDLKAAAQTTVGTVLGPMTGLVFSLYAIQRIPMGVASTIFQLSVIFLIPLSRLFLKERITILGLGGAMIAFLGTALLVLAS